MIRNQEEDEFVAVRVQDPRIQNEGSWNSYVDFKIFLHTNSKAFTAKTSCVRRRYSEFVWLKKKLQKNAGLVPVPELPGKSLFSFSNEDFLERRRKGLQAFLDKVVNMTVCLSDSQLHLFLQTQLPVGHIQDCVQGHTPYTVTDAILTYASSNRGLAQAQEDDSIKEPSLLTVSYESMESPAPHQPTEDTVRPELLSVTDPDPLEGLLEIHDRDKAEKSSVRLLQRQNHLEAVVEDYGPTEATFYLGSLSEQTQPRSCQIQTPVEVHSPMGDGFEEERTITEETLETMEDTIVSPTVDVKETENLVEQCANSVLDFTDSKEESAEESVSSENQVLENHVTSEGSDGDATDVKCPEENKDTPDEEREPETGKSVESLKEEETENLEEKVDCELSEKCANSVLGFTDSKEQSVEEDAVEDASSENQVLENHVTSEVTDVKCPEENEDTPEPEKEKSVELLKEEETTLQSEPSEIPEEDHDVLRVPEEEQQEVEEEQQEEEEEQEEERLNKEESDEDSQSLPSSNESIVKVSDEDDDVEVYDEAVKSPPNNDDNDRDVSRWPDVDGCGRNILDLQMNGCTEEEKDPSDIRDLGDSLDVDSTFSAGDLNENSDFSILETSRGVSELTDGRCSEQETLSSLCLDTSEDTHEVEVH